MKIYDSVVIADPISLPFWANVGVDTNMVGIVINMTTAPDYVVLSILLNYTKTKIYRCQI